MVKTEITLINALDVEYARDGYIKTQDIRNITVNAIVDKGPASLVITEELRKKLGLGIKEEAIARLANGQRVKSQLTDEVGIRWKDREWGIQAMVIPGAEEVFLSIQQDEVDFFVMDLLENVQVGIKS